MVRSGRDEQAPAAEEPGRQHPALRRHAPRWWGTMLYPAALVGLFLAGQALLAMAAVPAGQQASLAALPAVLALLLSLPWRLRRAWGSTEPWRRLGVAADPAPLARAALRGLIKAVLLLTLVVVAMVMAGQLSWQPRLSAGLLSNALLLGIGVGLAEELLFRGWLMGELRLLIGAQRALWLQAAIFSLSHTRFNLPLIQLLALLGGLLLLGLVLGLQRRADGGLLWGAVGIHGGLVGGWFLLQQGLLVMKPTMPLWLSGPANPIGSLPGWLALTLLLLARRPWWAAADSSAQR